MNLRKVYIYKKISKDIDDQSILQSDWKRRKSGHTPPEVVVSGAILS